MPKDTPFFNMLVFSEGALFDKIRFLTLFIHASLVTAATFAGRQVAAKRSKMMLFCMCPKLTTYNALMQGVVELACIC